MIAVFDGGASKMDCLPAIALLTTQLKNHMKPRFPFLNRAAWCAVMAAGSLRITASPGTAPLAADPAPKPDWLTELSLGIKETYDDNVLMVAGKTTPLNPAAMSPQDSWITTISPAVGLDFAARRGAGKTFQALSLSLIHI